MNEPTIPQSIAQDRVIRVFISSTFRDMNGGTRSAGEKGI